MLQMLFLNVIETVQNSPNFFAFLIFMYFLLDLFLYDFQDILKCLSRTTCDHFYFSIKIVP